MIEVVSFSLSSLYGKKQFLIKKCEDLGTKRLNDSKAFIKYSQCMDDIYNNIDYYNTSRKREMLIVFDDTIVDVMSSKKFQAIIIELFIRCRKLNISLAFIAQFYCSVPKEVRLNFMHYLIIKIHNQKKPQQIAINHSADTDYKYILEIYRKCTSEPYSFLTIGTTLTS